MAERISKHCWATPKCGIRTAQIHFPNGGKYEVKNSNFKFVIVRNPYARIVSFYISKVINKLHYEQTKKELGGQIPHLKTGKMTFTFEEMVPLVTGDGGAERHFKYQSTAMNITEMGTSAKDFHIVRCEHWAEDMKLVCEKLNLDHSFYGYVWENRSETTDSVIDYVGDKTPDWFRKNGAPSDYNLFYNDRTKEIVAEVYSVDFNWLRSAYDNFEMG